VLKWDPPHAEWFGGGKINISYNCLDRHLTTWRRNKAALIWEGETGETRTFTYQQLHTEVSKFANVLKHANIKRGHRVALYMPLIPELAIAMLACARIGATHSVVFGGFSSSALVDRINDAECKLVVTADGGWRRGSEVKLKAAVDEALKSTPSVRACIVVRRTGTPQHMEPERDFWWHELMETVETTFCTPRERRVSPKASCTRRRVTSCKFISRRSGCSISGMKTSTGARQTSDGSPDTATSFMDHSRTARRC
jgi:acetyl-CoA synthetase